MGAGALFFGNDSGEEMRKEDLKRYLHEVNNGVMKLIGSANVPLILAGVDNVVGEFRKMCKYTYLLDVCLTGNKDYTSEHELHKDAWNLIRPYFDQYTTSAVESYGDLSATKKTSSDIDEIVPASVYSRVDKLFLKENCHIWGYFDEKNNQVVLHKSYMKGDEDLANKAAIETLLHGGQVFMTSGSGMPEQTRDIAAVFRYEA